MKSPESSFWVGWFSHLMSSFGTHILVKFFPSFPHHIHLFFGWSPFSLQESCDRSKKVIEVWKYDNVQGKRRGTIHFPYVLLYKKTNSTTFPCRLLLLCHWSELFHMCMQINHCQEKLNHRNGQSEKYPHPQSWGYII